MENDSSPLWAGSVLTEKEVVTVPILNLCSDLLDRPKIESKPMMTAGKGGSG